MKLAGIGSAGVAGVDGVVGVVGPVGVAGSDGGTTATGTLLAEDPPPPPQADSRTSAAKAGTRNREERARRPAYACDELMRLIIDAPAAPIATNCNSWLEATIALI
jgi:hypothetical protein